MTPRSFKLLFFIIVAVFTSLVFLVPFISPFGSFINLDGSPGYIDHMGLWNSTNVISGTVYFLGDMLCHQDMSRSFILNGSEMPFCSRDVALLIGITVGLLFSVLTDGKKISRNVIIGFCMTSFVLIIADWIFQNVTGLNLVGTRVITGLLAGAAMSIVVSTVIDWMWKSEEARA